MPAVRRTREPDPLIGQAPVEASREEKLAHISEQLLRLKLARITDLDPGCGGFVDFASDILSLELTPAQAAVGGFLFDFQAPADALENIVAAHIDGSDPIDTATIFGGFTGLPPIQARRTALAVCGRGSGKTSILIAARALHLALTVPMTPLAKGEAGLVPLVAPDKRQGQHSLSFVKGFFSSNPILARALKVETTVEKISLTRPDGRKVSIEVRPASSGGRAVRGPSLLGVMLDEAAFFYGEGYEVSDIEIYRAAFPRLLPGGQIVMGTTPWAQSGLVWDTFRDNFGHPINALCVRAPTLVMRPSPETAIDYANAQASDPDNAVREYDAQFLSADAERFFPESLIEKALDKNLHLPEVVQPGERVRFGADFAFSSDSSSLYGFVERKPIDPTSNKPIPDAATVFYSCSLLERRPSPGNPLVPSEVVQDFAVEALRCGAKLVVADDHYREAVREHLAKAGLGLSPAPQPPAGAYVVARALMAQGRVKLPNNHRLLAQLRRVRSTIRPGGVVSIHQPRAKDGGHGDIVSALVCALSGVSVLSVGQAPKPRDRREAEAWAEKTAQTQRLQANASRLKKSDDVLKRRLQSMIGGAGSKFQAFIKSALK